MLIGTVVRTRDDLYLGVRCSGHGVPVWLEPGPNCHRRMRVGDEVVVFDQSRYDEEVVEEMLWHRTCVEAKLLIPRPDSDAYVGAKCLDCSRRLADPRDVYVFERDCYVDYEMIWHAHCVRNALDYVAN